ncbi:hypothetical protein [Pseudomonas putida]|uniref:hypothetical protein n=1 Tax=Pseudomonas putida TaxID=303 RepID=UPI003D96DCD0
MAIYTFKQGVFSKLAESIDELLKSRIVKWNSFGELLSQFRFFLHDEVAAYDVYRRPPLKTPQQKLEAWLPAISWVFVVSVSDDSADLILVEDSLPDYLGVLHQLYPLVERHQQRSAEVQAELGERR